MAKKSKQITFERITSVDQYKTGKAVLLCINSCVNEAACGPEYCRKGTLHIGFHHFCDQLYFVPVRLFTNGVEVCEEAQAGYVEQYNKTQWKKSTETPGTQLSM